MSTRIQMYAALRGQRLLVVGGDPREGALSRLHLAFGLADVIHCRTRRSDASPRCFASRLREPGIVLVIWALGLSRTHHGEHLHRQCRELGLPWVDFYRIPHPNALVARVEELRLLGALSQRCKLVAVPPRRLAAPSGGAA